MSTITEETIETGIPNKVVPLKFDTKYELNVESGGINASLKGIVYQVKTLVLALQKSRSKNFTIGTEIEQASCFDDALIHIPGQGTRFIQSKFRNNTYDLELSHFFDGTNRNYCLLKYFKSFLKLKEIFGNVRDVIICTNNKFICEQKDFIELKDEHNFKIQLQRILKSDEIFGNFEGRYKLDKNCEETKSFLKHKFIGAELIKCSKKDRNCDYTFMKAFRKFLSAEVFDETTKKFKNSFISSEEPEIVKFREIFNGSFNLELTKLTLLHEIYAEKSIITEDQLMKNLEEFMDKLLIVVGFKEEDIDNQLVPLFQEQFQLLDVTYIKEIFEEKLMTWVKDIESGDYFDSKKFKKLLQQIHQNLITVQRLIEKSSSIFQETIPEFQMPINLKSDHQLVYLQTAKGETFYGSCKIYQELKKRFSDTYLFLRTSMPRESLEEGIEIFKSKNSFKILVLECALEKNYEIFLCKIFKGLLDPKKQILVISDEPLNTMEFKFKRWEMKKVKLSDLTENSVKLFLENSFKFQEETVKFKELIDVKSLFSIFLEDLCNTKLIGQSVVHSKNYDPKLYIKRTLVHKNVIHQDIMNRKNRLLEDLFVFDEESFDHHCLKEPSKNIHLLKKLVGRDGYLWKKTRGSILELRKFIVPDDGTQMENHFQDDPKTFVLVDVAGMGKTSWLNRLAQDLKKTFKNHFIVNISFNDHTNYFKDHDFVDEQSVLDFLAFEVLKLKNEFEVELLHEACKKTGKVQVILDGLDETSPDFDESMLQMIRILNGLPIAKLYISTRPELGECLENLLGEFRHIFLPFSQEDQENFLIKFWNRNNLFKSTEEDLRFTAQRVIQTVRKSISDKEMSFTGIPLITRLVAEVYESSQEIEETFTNLYELFEIFVERKISIYLTEKMKLDFSNIQTKRLMLKEKKDLIKLYRKFAIQKILFARETSEDSGNSSNDEDEDSEMELEEEEYQTIRKCGIVSNDIGTPKFIHRTFGEFFVTGDVFDSFKKPKTVRLVLEKILQEDRFSIIRSFLNCCIKKQATPENYKIYGRYLRKYEGLFDSTLRVAIKEKNQNILDFLTNSLIQVESEKDRKLVEKVLIKKFSVLSFYCSEIEDNLGFLDKLKDKMGIEFVRKALLYDYCTLKIDETNLLYASARSLKNCKFLLGWMKENFRGNAEFWKELLACRAGCIMKYILCLHHKVFKVNSDSLFGILDELKEINLDLEVSVLEETVMARMEYGRTLLHLLLFQQMQPELISRFLTWIKDSMGLKSVKEIFLAKDVYKHFFLDCCFFRKCQTDYCEFSFDISFPNTAKYFENLFDWMDQQFVEESKIRSFDKLKILAFQKIFQGNLKLNCSDIPKSMFYFGILEETNEGVEFCDEKFFFYFTIIEFFQNFHDESVLQTYFTKILPNQKFNEMLEIMDKHILDINSKENFKHFGKFILKNFQVENGKSTIFHILAKKDFRKSVTYPRMSPKNFFDKDIFIFNLLSFLFKSVIESVENETERYLAKEFLWARDEENKTIFDYLDCFWSYFDDSVLDDLEKKFGREFVKSLLLKKICKGNEKNQFEDLHLFVNFRKTYRRLGYYDFFYITNFEKYFKVLKWTLEAFKTDSQSLEQILLSQDQSGNTFLHRFMQYCHDIYEPIPHDFIDILKFIKQISIKLAQKILQLKNNEQKTILHLPTDNESFASLMKFIKNDFGCDFMQEISKTRDGEGNTWLFYISKGNFDFEIDGIQEDFNREFLRELILIKNNKTQNFLYNIKYTKSSPHYKGKDQTIISCLNFILKTFGHDIDLFCQLFSTKDLAGTNYLDFFKASCEEFDAKNKRKFAVEKNVTKSDKFMVQNWIENNFKEEAICRILV